MGQIFAIEWFNLISTILRSIAQNSMDKKLFEILTVEIVGIYTQTKYLESLVRKIFVIEWFHLISMLIRSITQNAMDNKFSIRSFLVLSTHILHFHKKNLAVLNISRFTFCKVVVSLHFDQAIFTLLFTYFSFICYHTMYTVSGSVRPPTIGPLLVHVHQLEASVCSLANLSTIYLWIDRDVQWMCISGSLAPRMSDAHYRTWISRMYWFTSKC